MDFMTQSLQLFHLMPLELSLTLHPEDLFKTSYLRALDTINEQYCKSWVLQFFHLVPSCKKHKNTGSHVMRSHDHMAMVNAMRLRLPPSSGLGDDRLHTAGIVRAVHGMCGLVTVGRDHTLNVIKKGSQLDGPR
jgi:hypothetical protein